MSADSNPGQSEGSSPEKGRKLRRPLPATHERLQKGEFDTEEENPAVMKSKLSAEAPEFIPKYALHLFQDTSESQDSLYQDFQRLANVRPNHLDTSGESAADSFNDAVFSLTSNPGPMEEYMKRIVDMLESGITDMAVIQNIIETLIEQSISEANFRFTGAKICKYLTHALRAHPAFSDFRGLFLQRCKKEFDIRETLLDSNIDRLCGLSMFIGELFLILEIETNGVTTRLGLLRRVISDLLRTLLSKPDDVTVKCATQLLKLSGTAIMETKDLSNSGDFDDTFDKIKSLEKHPQLNKTSHCLINSVLSRLQYNFGVDQQPSPVKPMASPQYSNSSFSNEPIFYNIDGKPISREEAGFAAADDSDFVGMSREEQEAYLQWEAETYASQQGWMGPGAELGGDNGWGEEPQEAWSTGMGMDDYTQWSAEQEQGGEYYPDYGNEMDDEMAAAYEMFLKESGQNRH